MSKLIQPLASLTAHQGILKAPAILQTLDMDQLVGVLKKPDPVDNILIKKANQWPGTQD